MRLIAALLLLAGAPVALAQGAAPPVANAAPGWAGRYTASGAAEMVTYTLSLEGAGPYEGTLEAAGVQTFYKLRVRAVEAEDGLRVTVLGTAEGVPPWGFGVLPEPSSAAPLFTLRREGRALKTVMGTWPGGSDFLAFALLR